MSNSIQFIQQVLNASGINCGQPDGIYGPKTASGIKHLFASANITEPATWSVDRQIVAALQIICNREGVTPNPLAVDGYMGPSTLYAFEETLRYVKSSKKPVLFRNPEEEYGFDTKPKQGAMDWGRGDKASIYARYGDPEDKNFQRDYLTLIDLPYPLRIAWNPSQQTQKMKVHKELATIIPVILDEVLTTYGREQVEALGLDLFGGCYNLRKMRGGNKLSTHSWAYALDWDPSRNSLRTKWKQANFSKPAYTKWNEIWYDYNFINLGKEKNYDAMHYQPNFRK